MILSFFNFLLVFFLLRFIELGNRLGPAIGSKLRTEPGSPFGSTLGAEVVTRLGSVHEAALAARLGVELDRELGERPS